MALDCHSFNLVANFESVKKAISSVNNYFAGQSCVWKKSYEAIEDRRKKILDLYVLSPGDTVDDAIEWHAEDYEKRASNLKGQFERLPLS
jgi:hypothetical protein